MIDNKTPHLELPLPNLSNQQDEDVPRIAEALAGLDAHAAQSDARIAKAEDELGGAAFQAVELEKSVQAQHYKLEALSADLKEVQATLPGKAESGKYGLVLPGRGLSIATPGKLDVDVADSTRRGIGRVATLVDMTPGAEIADGPAFLSAEKVKITPTPTANAVPQADGSGKIDGWVTPTAILNASTLLTSSGTHTPTKTRLARITIKGGAGGGAGGTSYATSGTSGPGGGEAETVTFWALLVAGTVYSYTIGAGGLAGASYADGGNGGTTTWGSHVAQGGFGGIHASGGGGGAFTGGRGGKGGGTGLTKGEDGQAAATSWNNTASGGKGGGKNGGRGAYTEGAGQSAEAGTLGCGGGGGDYYRNMVGAKGGDGFVLIEFYDDSIVMN